jgi:sugar (pentulose or hexulose) kinase
VIPDTGCAPLRLVGGGARSPVWPSIMAGVFGQTVEVLMDPQVPIPHTSLL